MKNIVPWYFLVNTRCLQCLHQKRFWYKNLNSKNYHSQNNPSIIIGLQMGYAGYTEGRSTLERV